MDDFVIGETKHKLGDYELQVANLSLILQSLEIRQWLLARNFEGPIDPEDYQGEFMGEHFRGGYYPIHIPEKFSPDGDQVWEDIREVMIEHARSPLARVWVNLPYIEGPSHLCLLIGAIRASAFHPAVKDNKQGRNWISVGFELSQLYPKFFEPADMNDQAYPAPIMMAANKLLGIKSEFPLKKWHVEEWGIPYDQSVSRTFWHGCDHKEKLENQAETPGRSK